MLMRATTIMLLLLLAVLALATTHVQAKGLFGVQDPVQLVAINVNNGSQTKLGVPVPNEGQAQELTTIDDKNGIFYLMGFNFTTSKPNVLGLSVATGRVVVTLALPFEESQFVGVGQAIDFDAATGDLLVTGRYPGETTHTVARLNVQTGEVKKIATINAGDVLGSASAYNAYTLTEYLQFASSSASDAVVRRTPARQLAIERARVLRAARLTSGGGINLFGVNTKNGKVEQVIESGDEGQELTTIQYDSRSKSLVGLGFHIHNGTFHRTFVRFNSVAKVWTEVADFADQWLMQAGGLSAIDVAGRVLYVVMQKAGAAQTDPFYLVGINVDTGKVASQAVLAKFEDCPWSIEYHA